VSRSESIRVYRILPEPFDLANGMLTPSMKLRRDTIVQRYEAEIEAMYATSARTARRTLSEEFGGWDDSDPDDVFRRARH
jgi:long-chain acyl-CoA synthetase